jgi:hypothetical protein
MSYFIVIIGRPRRTVVLVIHHSCAAHLKGVVPPN